MDDSTYTRITHELVSDAATPEDVDALSAEADRRGDVRIQVVIALAIADQARASELADAADDLQIRAIVRTLVSWQCDPAWHGLFGIAAASAERLRLVEDAIAGWSDELRAMPEAWWIEIADGEHHDYHRLVRSVRFEGGEASILADAGARESLRHVTLVGLCGAGDDDLRALTLAGLDGVRELQLIECRLSCAGVADLIVAPAFPSLETLVLDGLEPDPPSAVPRSFASPHVDDPMPLEDLANALAGRTTQRARFDLALLGLGIDADGVRALGAQPALRGIGTLTFISCPIGPAEIAILAGAEHAVELTGLGLRAGSIGEAGVRSLGAAPFAENLRTLHLWEQQTTDAIAELLARIRPGALEVLDLPGNELGPRTAAVLAAADLGSLRRLGLSDNPLTDDDLARIVRNPTLRSLEVLEMLGTGAGEQTARALAEAEHLTTLRELCAGDQFGDGAAEILGGARGLHSLEQLGLEGVSDAAFHALEKRRRALAESALASD